METLFTLGGRKFVLRVDFKSYYHIADNGCHIWQKGLSPDGYAKIKINGTTLRGHRVAYAIFKGDFEQSLSMCHKCNNHKCVNPEHLYPAINQQNIIDAYRDGLAKGRPGEKHHNCKLTWEKVKEIRAKYQWRKVTAKMLGAEYGVSSNQIERIIKGKRWKTQPMS